MRPIDLARGHGLSSQAVRNYEEEGILPPAERTPHGYRVYTHLHEQALRTFVALIPGHGHSTATAILRAVNEGALDEALALVDESHVQLLKDRQTLTAVEKALHALAPTERSPAGRMFVGPLARQLRIRPATLRKWELAGLLHPERDRETGYRVYTADDVRDAHLAHQLRRGGYLLGQIAPLLAQVRAAGGVEPLNATLGEWRTRLTRRGRAMLTGAAELDTYLRDFPQSQAV
ncbi:TioE family transcriptional regulator [Amycolatopsis sp.]|jgi:DNA-binding transcriptional MerR regulator|uniref:TioE family transcriptional regulator n=1 Tax=Amycolatopsis sp. TaxID=37632 RepID=UPI002E005B6A|nr:TioE family transcriptional regulator [Amycolatopsis sp.]